LVSNIQVANIRHPPSIRHIPSVRRTSNSRRSSSIRRTASTRCISSIRDHRMEWFSKPRPGLWSTFGWWPIPGLWSTFGWWPIPGSWSTVVVGSTRARSSCGRWGLRNPQGRGLRRGCLRGACWRRGPGWRRGCRPVWASRRVWWWTAWLSGRGRSPYGLRSAA